ncbi:MAG: acetyl-CoA carboxylase biotin carboxyl carrier protein [Planctomycetota bacterium]
MTTKEPQAPDPDPRQWAVNFLEPKEIKRLIGILSAAGGLELELEHAGTKLRIRMPDPQGRTELVQAPIPYPVNFGAAPPQAPLPAPSSAEAAPADAGSKVPEGAVPFPSPMVGTFYRGASPDAEHFVKVGDQVSPDTTLCIIEAMKVMNEIKAEFNAEILQVLVENGEPVEFGQPLFLMRQL